MFIVWLHLNSRITCTFAQCTTPCPVNRQIKNQAQAQLIDRIQLAGRSTDEKNSPLMKIVYIFQHVIDPVSECKVAQMQLSSAFGLNMSETFNLYSFNRWNGNRCRKQQQQLLNYPIENRGNSLCLNGWLLLSAELINWLPGRRQITYSHGNGHRLNVVCANCQQRHIVWLPEWQEKSIIWSSRICWHHFGLAQPNIWG